MNGLVIFVGLLGGLSVFGLLGLVLGPVLVVTALGLLDGHVNHHSGDQQHHLEHHHIERRRA
jgi:predicted PurR-regulated permease PerM